MVIVAHFDLELHQMDVKMTFLNGDLPKTINMKQLSGFQEKSKEHVVYRLKKIHI